MGFIKKHSKCLVITILITLVILGGVNIYNNGWKDFIKMNAYEIVTIAIALLVTYYLTERKNDIRKLNKEELLELGKIAHVMGFGKAYSNFDKRITPKGYRILSEIKRITKKDIELLIKAFNDLPEILEASSEDISKIKGISKFKASSIVRGLKRLRNTLIMER